MKEKDQNSLFWEYGMSLHKRKVQKETLNFQKLVKASNLKNESRSDLGMPQWQAQLLSTFGVFFFFFPPPCLLHAEVPGPGIEPKPLHRQCRILNLLHHENSWMHNILRFYSHADCNKNYFDLSIYFFIIFFFCIFAISLGRSHGIWRVPG